MNPMYIVLIVVAAGLAAWLINRWLQRQDRPGQADWIEGAAGQQVPAGGGLPEDALAEVRGLLLQGQKIQAIKVVREYTGWGLKEAKDYVEALEAGHAPPPSAGPAAQQQAAGGDTLAGVDARIRQLISDRQKIQAIKLVREHTGWGLKEAKDYVEALSVGEAAPLEEVLADRPAAAPGPPPDLEAAVRQLLLDGDKIAAVKLVREHTDWGLKEAKDYVDRIEALG
jgi:ribosomal protein L7/L12